MPDPTFGSVSTGGFGTSATASVDAPSGVASGHYQIVIVSAASSSAVFGTTPAGWSLLADIEVSGSSAPDRGGSNELAVYESTTATGVFSVSIGSSRVWHAARARWVLPFGSAGRTVAPASTFVSSAGATSITTPAVTTATANSLAIVVGAMDTGPASNTVKWSGTDGYTARYNANIGAGGGTADGTAERQCILIADQVVASSGTSVTGVLTLSGIEEPAVVQVVLNGVADAAPAGPEPGRLLLAC